MMKTELLAWLINATVATSIAGIVVLLLRSLLQRWLGAEIAYRFWIVMPLAALAACLSLPQAAPQIAAPVASTPAAVVVRVASSLASVDADRWLLSIWLLGACALSVMLIWQQRRFVSRLRLRENGDGSWRSGIADVAPAVLGVLRQKLVLPDGFETDYSGEEQELVIAHERMHQQRRDPWALATCALLRTLFWFNPIAHFAAGHFRRDVEMACDAAVLRSHPGSRRRYASALLRTHVADGALPVGCLWNQTPPMKERIMLLKQALPTRHKRLAGAIMVAIAALGSAGMALAGHESALSTASALAASVPDSLGRDATFYKVRLQVQADAPLSAAGGTRSILRQSMAETVVVRAGETETIKADGHGHGPAWGMRFHVDPKPGSKGVVLNGDVFTHDEQHVIGHAHLAETSGTPLVIAMNDASTGTAYRIDAQVTPAPTPAAPPAPPAPPEAMEETAPAPPAPPTAPPSPPTIADLPTPPAVMAPPPPAPPRVRHYASYGIAPVARIPPVPPTPLAAPIASAPPTPPSRMRAPTAPTPPTPPTPAAAPVTPAPDAN